jgi:cell division protein ZapA (FtsZ GTPase activity inhibitor)
VMAALNLAHDLLRERKSARSAAPESQATAAATTDAVDEASLRRRIADMNSALDSALAGQGA